MIRIHLSIHGLVQGVLFRSNTKRVADNLNISGFVRNLPDGSVEVVAEGDKDKLDEFLKFCKVGPDRANVEKIDHKEEPFFK